MLKLSSLKIAGPVIASALAVIAPIALANRALAQNSDREGQIVECIKSAVERRDSGIKTEVSGYADMMRSLLDTRINDLLGAWNNSDRGARRKAIQDAWNKYKDSANKTKEGFNNARHNHWETYRQDIKSCGAGVLTEDVNGENADRE